MTDETPIEHWLRQVDQCELPIMSQTAGELQSAEKFIGARASRLTEIILQDPNMTARVLKLVNSVVYVRHQRISTVSRAILVLGYETIRSICLTSILLESLEQDSNSELKSAVVLSFQSALQARMIAEERGDTDSESIYVAALLFNLGEIAFWCSKDSLVGVMAEALKDGGDARRLQMQHLGFHFSQLTLAMTHRWHISEILQDALVGNLIPGSPANAVVLSNQVVRLRSADASPNEIDRVKKKIAEYAHCDLERTEAMFIASAEQAVKALTRLGLKGVVDFMGLPQTDEASSDNEDSALGVVLTTPDVTLQMNILRDLAMLAVSGKVDVNMVLQLVLEGIHKGIGFDRALVALMVPGTRALSCKYLVQSDSSPLRQQFNFEFAEFQQDRFIGRVLRQQEVTSSCPVDDEFAAVPSAVIAQHCGVTDCFAGPLLMGERCVGLYYADRLPSGRALDRSDFDAFTMFVSQATLCLRSLS